jgi:hypothetical protein
VEAEPLPDEPLCSVLSMDRGALLGLLRRAEHMVDAFAPTPKTPEMYDLPSPQQAGLDAKLMSTADSRVWLSLREHYSREAQGAAGVRSPTAAQLGVQLHDPVLAQAAHELCKALNEARMRRPLDAARDGPLAAQVALTPIVWTDKDVLRIWSACEARVALSDA